MHVWSENWHQAFSTLSLFAVFAAAICCLNQSHRQKHFPPITNYVSTSIQALFLVECFHAHYILWHLHSYPLQLLRLRCWLLHVLICCHNMQWCMALRTCHVHISPIPHQDLHNSRMFSFNSQAQRSQLLQMVFCIQVASSLWCNDNELVTCLLGIPLQLLHFSEHTVQQYV